MSVLTILYSIFRFCYQKVSPIIIKMNLNIYGIFQIWRGTYRNPKAYTFKIIFVSCFSFGSNSLIFLYAFLIIQWMANNKNERTNEWIWKKERKSAKKELNSAIHIPNIRILKDWTFPNGRKIREIKWENAYKIL